ncbi:TBC1 domain family member 22A-like [Octopus sinensis]|uniref:TBC1 domain family member 22A-like n=1 Tax=Octopus sinensis TaxID=2607531 RepID=A0A6P7U0S5_9MOLL|nr:TBC1 domain family member 22A-like [Octopus sinensis]
MVDIPRMSIPLDDVEDVLERVLYMWAVRHPASGYVQGINDLAVPFLCVYSGLVDFEAETFWSLTKLTEGIQDYYTPGQPGIFRSLELIEQVIRLTDS